MTAHRARTLRLRARPAQVLEHEKYNLAEGFYVVNMTYHLLQRGAAFCTDPQRDETLRRMAEELEAAMRCAAPRRLPCALPPLWETTLPTLLGTRSPPSKRLLNGDTHPFR